ncbi:hypothetical protein JOF56_004881 [Kibdelosporangium banguiense]|uniref:Uncharacterized protein n=1 Tax=Kibdelosporangium banguiense TaxID=1365924 RepID=A0ABS4TJ93_9PSEU|nr:hypothetical protein [Kibdelosporangium banguiense]MBP2324496.1 hypothetical protein [Kibdelosporangium banguiense]
MTVLLWLLLSLAVICTLGVVGGMVYASVRSVRGGTNLDYALIAVGGVTLFVDLIGGAAGIVLAAGVLDDPGARTLAGLSLAGDPAEADAARMVARLVGGAVLGFCLLQILLIV